MTLPYRNPSEELLAPSTPSTQRLSFILSLLGLIGIFAYLFLYHYHHENVDGGRHLGDFPTFYQAAQFARQHRDIYKAGHNADQMYVYPPLIAFLYTPLTFLSEHSAAHVAMILNLACLLGSVLLVSGAMIDRFDVRGRLGICLVAFVISALGENEMRAVMTMLETDALMLLMLTLALWWLDDRPLLAGAALGLAFNIKYLPIVMLPHLILRRRWRAVFGMLAGAVFFALLPAVLLGWHEDLRCLRVSMGGLLRWVGVAPETSGNVAVHDIGDGLSVSITSLLARLLRPHGFTNAAIMAIATCIAMLSLAIITVLYRLHGFSFWRSPSRTERAFAPFKRLAAMEWAGLMTAALVFSPNTNARHLVLAMVVNALAAVLILSPRLVLPSTLILAAVGASLIWFGFTIPIQAFRHEFYVYSVPGWFLLAGYLLILIAGLRVSRQANDRNP